MKKRYTLLAGLCVMIMAAAGCGKKEEPADAAPTTPEPTIEVSGKENMVEMEKSTGIDKNKITKVMGTKTATSSELVITNHTGFEINAFYTRPAGEEEWSTDYVQKKFTLKDKEQALFYYDAMEKDEDGNTITKYDLRVSYTDEAESDCMFRNLTLTDMEELKMNMEDGVPFVTYTSLSTKREVSTLEDAKARMGLSDTESQTETDTETETDTTADSDSGVDSDSSADSDVDSDSSADSGADSDSSADSSVDSDSSTDSSVDSGNDSSVDSGDSGTTEPGDSSSDSSGGDGSGSSGGSSGTDGSSGGESPEPGDSGEPSSDGRTAAENAIGQSLDSLMGTIGASDGSSYDVDPETGAQIGYYYYGDFTVSTRQDESGNEIVSGVW